MVLMEFRYEIANLPIKKATFGKICPLSEDWQAAKIMLTFLKD